MCIPHTIMKLAMFLTFSYVVTFYLVTCDYNFHPFRISLRSGLVTTEFDPENFQTDTDYLILRHCGTLRRYEYPTHLFSSAYMHCLYTMHMLCRLSHAYSRSLPYYCDLSLLGQSIHIQNSTINIVLEDFKKIYESYLNHFDAPPPPDTTTVSPTTSTVSPTTSTSTSSPPSPNPWDDSKEVLLFGWTEHCSALICEVSDFKVFKKSLSNRYLTVPIPCEYPRHVPVFQQKLGYVFSTAHQYNISLLPSNEPFSFVHGLATDKSLHYNCTGT